MAIFKLLRNALLVVSLTGFLVSDSVACSVGVTVVLCQYGARKPSCSGTVSYCPPPSPPPSTRSSTEKNRPLQGTYNSGVYHLKQFACQSKPCLTVARRVAKGLADRRRVSLVCKVDQLRAPAPPARGTVKILTAMLFTNQYRHMGINGRFAAQRCASLLVVGGTPLASLADALNSGLLDVELAIGRSDVSKEIYRGIIATIK